MGANIGIEFLEMSFLHFLWGSSSVPSFAETDLGSSLPRDGGANRTTNFDVCLDDCFEEEDVTEFFEDKFEACFFEEVVTDCFEGVGREDIDIFEEDDADGLEDGAGGFPVEDFGTFEDDGTEECFLVDCFEEVDLLDCAEDTE